MDTTFNLRGTLNWVIFDPGTLSAPPSAAITFTENNDAETLWDLFAVGKGARAANRLEGQDVEINVQEVATDTFRLLSAQEVIL
jgi:hypothetical protein